MTFLEWFKNLFSKKKEEPKNSYDGLEFTIFNPLNCKIGSFIEIKHLLGNVTYTVTKISEYDRIVGISNFRFTDYQLTDNKNSKILRVYPKEKILGSIQQNDHLLLSLIYEGEFDERIAEAVKCQEFYRDMEDGTRLTYYPYHTKDFECQITSINESKQTLHFRSKYWHYFRPPVTGELEEEIYLFVEIDDDDGYITISEAYKLGHNEVVVYTT